jgi:hypothetical protein
VSTEELTEQTRSTYHSLSAYREDFFEDDTQALRGVGSLRRTPCMPINGATLYSIAMGWKGQPWDDVEVLTGKTMKPTPGKKKTILLGKCMYQANKDHPDIRESFYTID